MVLGRGAGLVIVRLAAPDAPHASVYDRLAPLYDVVYGLGLEPGRRQAMRRLAPRPGERLLEVGIGTGASTCAYPRGVHVVGVDLSWPMLSRAARRLRDAPGPTVSLARMDAAALAFPSHAFDAVYAPYLVNVVPDPVAVGRELRRVCRPGGRLVLLNHFAGLGHGAGVAVRVADRVAGQIAARLGGVDWQVDLGAFLHATGLVAASIERVNFAGVTSLVVCRVPALSSTRSPLEVP